MSWRPVRASARLASPIAPGPGRRRARAGGRRPARYEPRTRAYTDDYTYTYYLYLLPIPTTYTYY
eukprot:496710-Heterocapsa_arctica.AAC.1